MIKSYALITGASSGIGYSLSVELAKRGYSLIAISNQPEQLEVMRIRLERDFGIEVLTLAMNLAEQGVAENIFNWCREKEVHVEVLVNNAGILVVGEAVHVSEDQVSTILNLHMHTPAMLCRLFGGQMKERGKGYILNVSSISAVMPYPVISFYGPTKAFLRAFTRALRTELRPYGVHVTCLLPGATSTSLYDSTQFNASLLKKIGLMKRPEPVAKSAIRALFWERSERVPGVLNKLIVILVPILPNVLISWINSVRIRKRKN